MPPHVATNAEGAGIPQEPGPALTLEDSVILRETQDNYVANPVALFLGPDDSFYIVDAFLHQVLRFDQAGEFVMTYGRQGRGPGEFGFIGDSGFATDELVGVVNWRPTQLVLFEANSGRGLGSVGLTPNSHHRVRVDGTHLWVTGIEEVGSEDWRAIGRVGMNAFLRAGDYTGLQVSSDLVAVPEPYIESPAVRASTGLVAVSPGEDDLLVGFGVSSFLLRVDRRGNVLDTLRTPAVSRRGVPEDEDELVRILDPRSYDEMEDYLQEGFGAASVLWELSREVVAVGEFVHTAHMDARWGGQGRSTGSFFISSMKIDGTGACVDTPLPGGVDERVVPRLRGNEIFALDQRISNDSDHVRTVVRRYTIDPMRCTGEVRTRSAAFDRDGLRDEL